MPRGANARVFGTNPIAFATPIKGGNALIMDFATSTMSQGDLRIAREEGRQVPIGTGLGTGGRDTQDPGEILDYGGILPFGGHKGAALSLMVELLASALTSKFSAKIQTLSLAKASLYVITPDDLAPAIKNKFAKSIIYGNFAVCNLALNLAVKACVPRAL